MKIAYIMRGVAGSGKSTRARELVGKNGIIHSTDDYSMEGGRYNRDASLLGKYHHWNLIAFSESLDQGLPVVICDNTNSHRWEFQPYIDAAVKRGYRVEIVTMPHPNPEIAAKRNIHNVPADAIRAMIQKWEP